MIIMLQKLIEIWDKISNLIDKKQWAELKNILKNHLKEQFTFQLTSSDKNSDLKKYIFEFTRMDKEKTLILNKMYVYSMNQSNIDQAKTIGLYYISVFIFNDEFQEFLLNKTKEGTKIRDDLQKRLDLMIQTAKDGYHSSRSIIQKFEEYKQKEIHRANKTFELLKEVLTNEDYRVELMKYTYKDFPVDMESLWIKKNILSIELRIWEKDGKYPTIPQHAFIPTWFYKKYKGLPSALQTGVSFTNGEFNFKQYFKTINADGHNLEMTVIDPSSLMEIKATYTLAENEIIIESELKELKLKYSNIILSGIITETSNDSFTNIPIRAKMKVLNVKPTAGGENITKIINIIQPSNKILKLFEPISFALHNPKASKYPYHQDLCAYEIRCPTKNHNYYHIVKVDDYDESTGETIMEHGFYYKFSKNEKMTEVGNFGLILNEIEELIVLDEVYGNIKRYLSDKYNFIYDTDSNMFIKKYTESIVIKYKIFKNPNVIIRLYGEFPKNKDEAMQIKERFDWKYKTEQYEPTQAAINLMNMASSIEGESYPIKDYIKANYKAAFDSANTRWTWQPKTQATLEYLGNDIAEKLKEEKLIIEEQVKNKIRFSKYWVVLRKKDDPLFLYFVFNDPPVLEANINKTPMLIEVDFNSSVFMIYFKFEYDKDLVSIFQALPKGKRTFNRGRWQFNLKSLPKFKDNLKDLETDVDLVFDYIITQLAKI